MFDLQNIKLASERNRKAVQLQPSLSRGSFTAKSKLSEDLSFDIDVDGVRISAEVPKHYGGKGVGPGSAAHAISSLICCAMVGYLIKFAEKDIPVSGLGMEVHGDWDESQKAEFTELRYIVNVDSEAPEQDIQQAIAEADAESFGLANFQQRVATHRQVHVTAAV